MDKFIQTIINEVKIQLFNEEGFGDKTVLALYPGRFQPMGRHHKAAYDWLAKQFGQKNTYVVTSDKTEALRSPFNFAEKKRIINRHGIKNVVKARSPYFPKELLQKFDPDNTVLIYMIGEKDTGRLSGYKRLMKYNKTTAIPFKDLDNPYAYYVYAPHISFDIPSFGEMSGTNIRKALSDQEAKLSDLKSRFKSIMGWFDPSIFNMIIQKMNSRRSPIKEDLNEWFRVLINMSDVQADMFFNIIKKEYGDTKDLLRLIQKYRKTKNLTADEKKMFQEQFKDLMKLAGLSAIAAIPIPGTMLLIPVIVQAAKKFNINLLPESAPPIKQESKNERLSIVTREFWNKVFSEVVQDEKPLLTEGGAAGHMAHVFEDMDLTFADLKEMIRLGLSGEITIKGNPTEKLDGQNLFVTFKGDKLYAARNKGDIKKGGMSYVEVEIKFKGRGEIERAFTYAFKDLEKAIQALSPRQQELVFKNGTAWMNLEIIYPESANVINYDGAYIVFHGSGIYDENGEKVQEYPRYASMLAGMIKQVNANTQEVFSISKPKSLIVKKSTNYQKKVRSFIEELTRIQNQMGCKNTHTLRIWHRRWWTRYIKEHTTQMDSQISPVIIQQLVKRWAFNDKSFALNSKNIENKELLAWAKEVEKTKLKELYIRAMKPFDLLILRFGAEVLKNVEDVMALNPEKTTAKIRSDVQSAINTLSSSTDVNDLKVLQKQLSRIKAAGGLDAIVPLEGLVFTYNGKSYKLTGAFAPINQLLGYFKFGS